MNNEKDLHPSLAAWRKWFKDSGCDDYWKDKDVEKELGRERYGDEFQEDDDG